MNGSASDTNSAKAHPDLFKKTLKGGGWLFAGRIFQQVLNYTRWIVLAKLLHPRDFGAFGIAMLVTEIIGMLTETGFQKALIQKKEEVAGYLNSVWTVGILRGFIMLLILLPTAPWLVELFEGSWQFNERDIKDTQQLVLRLQDDETPLAQYLRQNLAVDLNTPREPDKAQLAEALNQIVRQESLRDPQFYETVNLSSYARSLLDQPLEGESLYRANRLLLEEAFPDALQRNILNKPDITAIIRVFALILFLGSFANVGILFFEKEMEFHKFSLLQILAAIVTFVTTVALAWYYRNVWALVWGRVAGLGVSLVSGYLLHPYRPRFELNLSKLRHLWKFGRWITFTGILGFLLLHGDDLFLGRVLGATALGFYLMAFNISNLPNTEITQLLMRLTFPVYSKIQDDIPRLRAAYLKMNRLVAFVTFFISGMIVLFAKDFVVLVMGPKWLEVIPCLQVLAVWGLIRPLGSTSGSVFMSLGHPSLITRLQLFKLAMLAVTIYPLTVRYGITGTALSVLISSLLVQVPTILHLRTLLRSSVRHMLNPLTAPLLGTVVSILAVFAVKQWLFRQISFVRFFSLAAAASAIYVSAALLIDRFTGRALYGNLLEYWRFLQEKVRRYG